MRGSKSVFVRYGARVLVLVLGLAAAPLACLAATINVTTTGDAGGAGGCTVRQAIATINNGAGPDANTGNCSIASGTLGTNDTIHFDLATFPNGGGNTITLADASTSTLSIYAANLIIDATANGQVVIQRPSGAATNADVSNASPTMNESAETIRRMEAPPVSVVPVGGCPECLTGRSRPPHPPRSSRTMQHSIRDCLDRLIRSQRLGDVRRRSARASSTDSD